MKIHRFIGDFDLDRDVIQITNQELVHQMSRVLRPQVGALVTISDGMGVEVDAEISDISKNNVTLTSHGKRAGLKLKNNVHLYLCVIKRNLFELAVEKATECGVTSITPIVSDKTETKNLAFNRLNVIAKEASEQCGRSTVPTINESIDLETALTRAMGTKIFCSIDGEEVNKIKDNDEYSIFIGPEGGWSNNDLELAHKYDAIITTLGLTTLRAETAAIISTYLFANK